MVNRRLEQLERRILRRIPDLGDQISRRHRRPGRRGRHRGRGRAQARPQPDGYASEPDGTYSYQFNRGLASGKLEILASEYTTP